MNNGWNRAFAGGSGRLRRPIMLLVVPALLVATNVAPAMALIDDLRHDRLIHSAEYQREFGRWDVVDLPSDAKINAIHAALLPSGKLLIVAGSGNDQDRFDAGTFSTLLYDPSTGSTSPVPTPGDLFCGGHAFLPDGKLLVAGGTLRYEKLAADVTRAAGGMLVKNEFPDAPRSLPEGTGFTTPGGQRYRSTTAVTIPAATKKTNRKGVVTITAGETRVWVEAEQEGPEYVTEERRRYAVDGLVGASATEVYGIADKMTLEKQEFQGMAESYEFDPATERYERVGDLNQKRWYPTLAGLSDGTVIAVSGLDGTGQVLEGQNEVYDPASRAWTERPDLRRYFPTYPALFPTARGELFYSGSNAGYGPDDEGRAPGFWNLTDNRFSVVPGLRDADQLETSASGWLGPVQDQKVIVVGGGGVGDVERSTGRIDAVDLDEQAPHFTPGADLPRGTRYPNLVQLPDDATLITGGSEGYRGNGHSDNLTARIYRPDGTMDVAADPTVGRNYHSEAVLLPDGRVITLGSDPLFRDADNTLPGRFEKRIEIFTPPYLFQGPRPTVGDAPSTVERGATMRVPTPDPAGIATARLLRPGAVTHVTDTEQRSVALEVDRVGGAVELTVPKEATIVPAGYYMLFLTAMDGTPSVARWVQVR